MSSTRRYPFAVLAIAALLAVTGCSDRDPAELDLAVGNRDPLVYGDDYGEDVYFQPFFETHYRAVTQDSVYAYEGFAPDGARSLKINIPPAGSALGLYSGGVLSSAGARDLTTFNALTFYARTDMPAVSLNEVGMGNDNTGTSRYGVSRTGLALTRDWAFHIVPIPGPSKLFSERGLFTFAEGLQEEYPDGYNIWVDEIRFASLGNIEIVRPQLTSLNSQYFVGARVPITGASTIFRVDGAFMPVGHSAEYYDFVSSDPAVATVSGGEIRIVGTGSASITATLEEVAVAGTIFVTGVEPPTEAAVPPTLPAEDVISMFSDVYLNVPVDEWTTFWGQNPPVTVKDQVIAGDNTKLYTSLSYTGIIFENAMINASDMTHLHVDVYAPTGTNFKLEIVSFPSDPAYEKVLTEVLTLDGTSEPPFVAGTWSSLDVPLADFVLREGFDWTNIGQFVISTTDARLVLVDNLYWHR